MAKQPLAELKALLQERCFQYGDFTLSSGRKSRYYYNGKLVTLSPRGAYLVGQALTDLVRPTEAQAIGGLAIGADPIVTAVALVSGMDGGRPIPAFIVRKEAKGHGARDRIAASAAVDGGELIVPGLPVALVDDVVTTAGSILQAAEAAEAAGCRVVLTLAIVDRQEGGAEALAARGYPFQALFRADMEGRLSMSS